MSVILDLIGSVLIAAFVILIGLRLNASIAGNADSSKANVNVQEAMVDIVRNIEYDFRKIGYGVPETQWAILDTGSTYIRFLADIQDAAGEHGGPDGILDTVEWYTGPPLIGKLGNDSIRVLYRRINGGTPVGAALGVTKFRLRYLNQDGGQPVSIGAIYIIETTLQVESPYKVMDQINQDESYEKWGFSTAFWRQTRLASRNIKRHG
jgi:hypothetical protein